MRKIMPLERLANMSEDEEVELLLINISLPKGSNAFIIEEITNDEFFTIVSEYRQDILRFALQAYMMSASKEKIDISILNEEEIDISKFGSEDVIDAFRLTLSVEKGNVKVDCTFVAREDEEELDQELLEDLNYLLPNISMRYNDSLCVHKKLKNAERLFKPKKFKIICNYMDGYLTYIDFVKQSMIDLGIQGERIKKVLGLDMLNRLSVSLRDELDQIGNNKQVCLEFYSDGYDVSDLSLSEFV